MNIAIIGTGNVGGALATKWANAGHTIYLGVKDLASFKGKALLENKNTTALAVTEAVAKADVILLAVPAPAAGEVAATLGDTTGKIIIDAMNVVMGRGPVGFSNTADAILANTATRDVVKCFNTTGFNNMQNTQYGETAIDAFMAGDSTRGKEAVRQLALDAGFAECYNVGGNDRFLLMEQFAFSGLTSPCFRGRGAIWRLSC
jgi:8-hydroxy-5-deazaflavin:NADPH oxidoreductase